jgi:hypothetical protein
MENSQTYFFVATCIASAFGFVLAFILNRFVNKLDQRLDQYDKLFSSIQEEISELKESNAVTNTRVKHLEDTVYIIKYPKK